MTSKKMPRPILLLTLGVLAAAACTRDPFDRGRPEIRFPDKYDYRVVLPASAIHSINVDRAPDGRLGIAVAGQDERVTLYESAAGTWIEVRTLSEDSIRVDALDLAAAPMGDWWVLTGREGGGVLLFRLNAGGDSTIVVPQMGIVAWDSTNAVLASDAAGHPIMLLRRGTLGLYQVTRADTGWVFDPIAGTNGVTPPVDIVVDGSDQVHELYYSQGGQTANYRRVGTDSTHTSVVPNSGLDGALAVDTFPDPWVIGTLGSTSQLYLWRQEDGSADWYAEPLPINGIDPFPAHFALALDGDDRPWALYSAFHGAERYDLYLATRNPDVVGINWDREPVVQDVPKSGVTDRQLSFRMLLDDLGTLHIFYLTGEPGDQMSALYEVIPR